MRGKNLLKRILSSLIMVTMLLNTILTLNVFGATGFDFKWETEQSMTDTLVLQNGSSANDVFLWWTFGKNNGISFDRGSYTLSYNIADNKRVDFVVEKNVNKATVTYKVWDYSAGAYISNDDASFMVYKPATSEFVEPRYANYPPTTDDFRINYGLDGKPTSFSITPGTGFSFKYDNKSIRFKWVEGKAYDVFYFETDGIEQGNLYDFNVDLVVGGSTTSESLQVFTGINSSSFNSTPYANSRKTVINHSERPFPDPEDPGFEPEIVLDFDLPKVWDDTTHKFVLTDSGDLSSMEQMTVTLSLGNSYSARRAQIKIDNVYADDVNAGTTVASSDEVTVYAERKDGKIYITLGNLAPGVIYNPSEISLYEPNNLDFLATKSPLEQGTVYTYPEYTVVADDIDEFYLRIKPFEDYKGYYTVYQGDSAATLAKWIEYEDKNGKEDYIYIPIDLYSYVTDGELPEKFFRVDFSFTPPTGIAGMDNYLTSQILRHKPSDDDIVIGTPENLTLDDVYVVRTIDNENEEVVMTYSWDMAYKETLAAIAARNGGTLDIICTFHESLIPNDLSKMTEFTKIKATVTSADGKDFDMTLSLANDIGELVSSSYSTKEVIKGNNDKYNTVVPTVTLRYPTVRTDNEEKEELFEYPNTYFVNVSAQYQDGSRVIATDSSTPQVKVRLDDIVDIDVPAPQKYSVKEDGVTENSLALSWNTMKYNNMSGLLYQYYQGMVKAKGMSFAEKSIKYNLYLSQAKDGLDTIIKYQNDRDHLPEAVADTIKTITLDENISEIDFKTKRTDDGTSAIEWIRSGNIILIKDLIQDPELLVQVLKIDGLDENQVYYSCAETTITPYYEEENGYREDFFDHSVYSSVVSGTLTPNPETIEDKDNPPKAPNEFGVQEYDMSSAQLKWSPVRENPANPESNSYIEYQFIRITGKSMSHDFLDTRLSMPESMEKAPNGAERIAVKVDELGRVFLYDAGENKFSDNQAAEDDFSTEVTGYAYYYLKDKTLIPNELYFYYVRAVRMVNGEEVAYSTWMETSVTTSPVDSPKNLKVESLEEYDRNSEVTISFDVPVTQEDLIAGTYVVQYSIKKDDGDWTEDRDINPSKLTMDTITGSDDIHCLYTISGLVSNAMYHLRVRLYHTDLGAASLYSNTVEVRTDFDQEKYDDERKAKNWIDYYKDKINDIITNPYWMVYDSLTSTTVVYRPNSFQNIITGTTDTSIQLAQGENNGAKKVYYLPSKAIDEAYAANKGFRITWNDADVVIAPRSIDPSTNAAILDAKDAIKETTFKDYFVKVTANFSQVSYLVNGEPALSPVVDLEMEVIGTKRVITEWDKNLAEEIIEKAFKSDKINAIVKSVKEDIGDDYTNEQLLDELKDEIDDFVDEFQDKVETKLNSMTSRNYTVSQLAGYVYVAYPVSSNTNVQGNKNENGVWVTKDVVDYNNKKAILTDTPGTYALTGKTITIPALDGVPGSTSIINLIGKYNLDDYLGKGNALNLSGSISRSAVIGCAARMSGAGKTDDPVAYLASRGISTSSRAPESAMQGQEVLYLVMGVYGIRTNTKVETIQIRNYTLTANIKNIAPTYKKSVQAAYETGIYTNPNFIATSPMSVKDFLMMLPALASKTKL